VTSPWVLQARTALWAVHQAVGLVPEAIRDEAVTRVETGPPAVAPRRTRTALAAMGVLLRQERWDREHGQAPAGTAPGGASPAPVRAELLDAPALAMDAVVDAAWILASHLRRRPLLVYGYAWRHASQSSEWGAAHLYLRTAMQFAAPAVAGEICGLLEGADCAVRSALRIARDRRQVPGNPPCPCCGQRLLRIDTAPPRPEWTVTCTAGCRCTGEGCPCGMPAQVEQAPHVWELDQVWARVPVPATVA
jgi:hypothetical protein